MIRHIRGHTWYIPELKKYDSILFLHQTMTSGQPLKTVLRHMAHPVFTAHKYT
jgi:hypothetical protein